MTAAENQAKVISENLDGMWVVVGNGVYHSDSIGWDSEVVAIYRNGERVG